MTDAVTALFVFCEGAHDLAFLRRVLKHPDLRFQKVGWRFSEFPSPLNSLFATNVQRHAADDLTLDMAHKFYLPDRVYRRANLLLLLFNAGGKHKPEPARTLLEDFLDLQDKARIFPGGATAVVGRALFLFLLDADSDGAEAVRSALKARFGTVADKPWLTENWVVANGNQAAAIAGDVACYVWADHTGIGTLEDLLQPVLMVCDSERCVRAEEAIDALFTWETDHPEPERAVAERAKRQKAVITLLGQRAKPGFSQSVVIHQTDVIGGGPLHADPAVDAFVRFLVELIDEGQEP